MSHSQRLRALAGGLVLIAGLTAVSGCGDRGNVPVKTDQGKVSVDAGNGGASAGTGEGTTTAGKGLPDGFPTDKVPLVDAKVVTSVQGPPGGRFAWSVVMQTPRAIDDVTAEIKKELTGAGYAVKQANEMGDVTIMQFTGTSYDVSVTAARTGGEVTVTYLVKAAS